MSDGGSLVVGTELDSDNLLKGADEALKELTGKLGEFGSVLEKGAPILAIGAIGKALFDVGEEFEEAENTIEKQTGATGDALDTLVKQSQKVATTVPVSFQDAAEAISIFRQRTDATGSVLTGLTKDAAQLAKVLGEDVNTTATESANVIERWNLPLKDASASLDLLFSASQKFGVSFDDLTSQVSSSATVFKGLGFSFAGAVDIIGKLDKAGVNTNGVIAGLRGGLAKLSKSGGDTGEAFEHLVKKIYLTRDSSKATAEAVKIFGARAGPELAAQIKKGAFSTENLVDQIDDTRGSIDKAETSTRTFGDKLDILANKIKLGVEPAATALVDVLTRGLDAASEHFSQFSSVAGKVLDGLTQGFQTVTSTVPTSAFQALGAAIVAFEAVTAGAEVVQSAFVTSLVAGAASAVSYGTAVGALAVEEGVLSAASLVAADAMGALDVAMDANPIGLVALGVGALVAAFVLFGNSTDDVTRAEEGATRATQALHDAYQNLQNSALDARQAQLDVTNTTNAFHDSMSKLLAVRDKYGKGSPQFNKAQRDEIQAWIDMKRAQERNVEASEKTQKANAEVRRSADDQAKAIANVGDKIKDTIPKYGTLSNAATGLSRATQRNTEAANKFIDAEGSAAQKIAATSGVMDNASHRSELLSLAAVHVAQKIHDIPTAHQINVFYRNNMALLISEAQLLRDHINEIPSRKQIDIVINQIGDTGSQGITHSPVHGSGKPTATGGVVTGGVRGKDSVPTLLKPGEDVLNEVQQKRLADLLFGGGDGATAGAQKIDLRVYLDGEQLESVTHRVLNGVEREVSAG